MQLLGQLQQVGWRAAFSILLIAGCHDASAQQTAAVDALKQCDALASHPHDSGRFAAGVTEDGCV